MESSSRAAQLQNAIRTTISGQAQLITAGCDVVITLDVSLLRGGQISIKMYHTYTLWDAMHMPRSQMR